MAPVQGRISRLTVDTVSQTIFCFPLGVSRLRVTAHLSGPATEQAVARLSVWKTQPGLCYTLKNLAALSTVNGTLMRATMSGFHGKKTLVLLVF